MLQFDSFRVNFSLTSRARQPLSLRRALPPSRGVTTRWREGADKERSREKAFFSSNSLLSNRTEQALGERSVSFFLHLSSFLFLSSSSSSPLLRFRSLRKRKQSLDDGIQRCSLVLLHRSAGRRPRGSSPSTSGQRHAAEAEQRKRRRRHLHRPRLAAHAPRRRVQQPGEKGSRAS